MTRIGTAGKHDMDSLIKMSVFTNCDRCEYILYRGLYRVSYARVSRSTITDTVKLS